MNFFYISTCFVMLQVLRRCGGSVKLLDVSSELPQLIRRPGLKRWKVCLLWPTYHLFNFIELEFRRKYM